MKVAVNQIRKEVEARIAFVTYNRIGSGQFANGLMQVNGFELYLFQNSDLSKWGCKDDKYDAWDFLFMPKGQKKQVMQEFAKSRKQKVSEIMSQAANLQDMDKVYIYVGQRGGEGIIKLSKKLPGEHIVYVMCDCQKETKLRLIKEYGHQDAEIIWCECGGQETMEKLVTSYL